MKIEFKDLKKLMMCAYINGWMDSKEFKGHAILPDAALEGWRKWKEAYLNSQEAKRNEH